MGHHCRLQGALIQRKAARLISFLPFFGPEEDEGLVTLLLLLLGVLLLPGLRLLLLEFLGLPAPSRLHGRGRQHRAEAHALVLLLPLLRGEVGSSVLLLPQRLLEVLLLDGVLVLREQPRELVLVAALLAARGLRAQPVFLPAPLGLRSGLHR